MIPITDYTPLTPEEAAQILKISRYTLYKLIERGEIPARRIGKMYRIDYDSLMQYLQGNSVHQTSSESVNNTKNTENGSYFNYVGSHDIGIELLSDFLGYGSTFKLQTDFTGSMEGLISLFHREAQFTGIHLWDEKTQEYNAPFARYLLSGEKYILINLVQRVQGWIVPLGNPHNINSWEDISRKGLRFVNRQRGSGTRLRIDQYLSENEIPVSQIQGYNNVENTHLGVAFKVANGEADFGIGIQFAAQKLGLDFAPLFKERFDIVVLQETIAKPEWQEILSILNSAAFHRAIEQHAGYDTSLTGTAVYKN
ncbi:MAG: helix-turn-helix transcriptional regulator [Syntrophomonadaceae bacterium]